MSDGLVLITGGAGFIGSHTAAELLRAGYRVRAMDNLCQPVHDGTGAWPAWVPGDVERVVGDGRVRTPDLGGTATTGDVLNAVLAALE